MKKKKLTLVLQADMNGCGTDIMVEGERPYVYATVYDLAHGTFVRRSGDESMLYPYPDLRTALGETKAWISSRR